MQTEAWKRMADEMTKISWRDEMRNFLERVLSESEKVEVAKRWEIQELVKMGMSQRKIAKKMGMSLTTVQRWKKGG